jgi:hypothetical protein
VQVADAAVVPEQIRATGVRRGRPREQRPGVPAMARRRGVAIGDNHHLDRSAAWRVLWIRPKKRR